MATIANLVVKLSTNTKGFERGMNRSKKNLKGFSAGAGSARAAMVSAGAGIAAAAAAAAAAVGSLAVSQVRALDSTIRFADRLGMTAAKLQQLHHAAGMTGVKTDTMNMALQRMTRRIAEAAKGTGEAKAALKELGLDAQQLSTAGPSEAFSRIADAIKSVENPADRVRLAFKLFDSEGVALVNTLKLGSDGLEKYAKEANRLGLTISKVDQENIDKANKAIEQMKAAWGGVKNVLAAAVAPMLKRLAAIASKFLESIMGFLRWLGNVPAAEDTAAKSAAELARQNERAAEAAKALAERFRNAANFAADVARHVREINTGRAETIDRIGSELKKSLRTPAEILEDKLRRFRQLRFVGGIDDETYNRAVAKAREEYERATASDKAKPRPIAPASLAQNAATGRNTAAAYSAMLAAKRMDDPERRALRDQVRLAQEAQRTREEIARNTEDQPKVANI